MLVIIEKPAMVEWVDATLREVYPGEPLEYLIASRFGQPFVFDYPRNLKWDDYPFVQPARYKRVEAAQYLVTAHPVKGGGTHGHRRLLDYTQMDNGQTAIAFTNVSNADIAAAMRLRRHLEQLGAIAHWTGSFVLTGTTTQDVQTALTRPLRDIYEHMACTQTAIKADFDYSFLVNAAGLLARCYHAAGGEFENPVFSKYTVQALYALRSDQRAGLSTRDGDVMHRFQNWKGTGRYDGTHAQLGSCSSQLELLDALEKYGLVAQAVPEPGARASWPNAPARHLELTVLGGAFLAKLHPDCEDKDLPFRIAAWQESPSQKNREASQRYLRTWFGKQKVFMERTGR